MVIITFIRFHHVKLIISHDVNNENNQMKRFNNIGLMMGLLCSFGISIVGNFQVLNYFNIIDSLIKI